MRNSCFILIAMLVVMSSCTKVNKYYLGDEAKSWLVDDDKREFIIRDENGIERCMHVKEPSIQYVDVTMEKAERERMHQIGTAYSSGDSGYYVDITAGWGNEANVDDRFEIGLHGLPFTFSLNGKTFTPMARESLRVEFTAELLDSFEVNGVAYPDVLHIQLNEYEHLIDKDPVEIYYAKHYGLIQYTIQYGITYFRVPAE